jgi:uncharacterized membrane protein YbhN (UPF0104 family)
VTAPSPGTRILRRLATVLVIGFAVYVLLPQVGEIGQALAVLRSGRWRYLGLVMLGTVITFVAAGWMVSASTTIRLPFTRTILGQVAASFMATVTPARVGWVVVTEGFLHKAGADEHSAYAASALNLLITFLSHLALLLVLLPFLPSLDLPPITAPPTEVVVVGVIVLLVAAGVVIWLPRARRRILSDLIGVLAAMPSVISDPRRSFVLVLGAVAGNIGFAIALAGSVAAFGPVPSFLGILVAYMLAATLSAVAPTPGGLGAMEAALVTALVRLGVESGAAVASVLTFRLATFWLPMPIGAWVLRLGRREGWL